MVFSVCPSVCHTFFTMFPSSYHHEIFWIYCQWQKVHAKGQGQRSKVKVTEVKTQLNRFRTVTPVWILILWWNDAHSLTLLRRGALLFFQGHPSNFKVTRLKKIVGFDPDWAFPDCNSSWNSPMATKMMHTAWSSIKEVSYCFWRSSVKFQSHTALKIVEFDPNWAFPDCNSRLNSPMIMEWCTKLEVT